MNYTWISFESKECHSEHCFFQTCHGIGIFWDIVHQCVLSIERACFLEQPGWCDVLLCSQYCVCISWLWKNRARNGYCATFVCWPCWTPQDGCTPLYQSAFYGHKEVVEILLQNGAEVNAANKVICDEWKDGLERNACEGGGNEGLSVGTTFTMADCIEPMVHG